MAGADAAGNAENSGREAARGLLRRPQDASAAGSCSTSVNGEHSARNAAHACSTSPSDTDAAGTARDVGKLDADDRAMHARFVAVGAEAEFEWPIGKERSGKGGKKDVKRRRKNRDARNTDLVEKLQIQAAQFLAICRT